MPDESSEIRDSASLLEETSAEESEVDDELGEGHAANDGNEEELSFSQVELAVHTLLYIRQVYPFSLFEQRIVYGIPVYQCANDVIRQYIWKAVDALAEELLVDNVSRMIIVVHQDEVPLEKFIFTFTTVLEKRTPDESMFGSQSHVILQRQIRSLILKLFAAESFLHPLPSSGDISFSFVMQLREDEKHSMTNHSSHSEENESGKTVGTPPINVDEPALIHIMKTDVMEVTLHVLESEEKPSLCRRYAFDDEIENSASESQSL